MILTKENLVDIISKSVLNARSLYDDAMILKHAGRIERAYTLFQLSTEESGKALMALGFLLYEDYKDASRQKQFIKELKDHQHKTTKAMNLDGMIADSVDDPKERRTLREFFYQRYSQVSLMNDRKNYSLYVSILEDKVVQPSDVIKLELVEEIKLWANFRCVGVEKLMSLAIENIDELMAVCSTFDKEKMIKDWTLKLKEESNLKEDGINNDHR